MFYVHFESHFKNLLPCMHNIISHVFDFFQSPIDLTHEGRACGRELLIWILNVHQPSILINHNITVANLSLDGHVRRRKEQKCGGKRLAPMVLRPLQRSIISPPLALCRSHRIKFSLRNDTVNYSGLVTDTVNEAPLHITMCWWCAHRNSKAIKKIWIWLLNLTLYFASFFILA